MNSKVDKFDFSTTWNNFRQVAAFVTSQDGDLLLGVFDWAKAYRQIPVWPSQWQFLMILNFEDEVLLDTRVQFGGVTGCGTFGMAAEAWRDIIELKFHMTKSFRWVDDILFVKRLDAPQAGSMAEIVVASTEMGVVTNDSKWREFGWEQRYLGFVWNGKNKTVRLPQPKLNECLKNVVTFLAGNTHTYKELQVLMGRLNHTSHVFPQMRAYCAAGHCWLALWHNKNAVQQTPEEVRDNLQEWKLTLETAEPLRVVP